MSPPGDNFIIQRHKMIRRVKKLWLKDINTSLFYTPGDAFKDENSIYMDEYAITHIVGYMTDILDKRYEKMLKEETISFEEVEYYTSCQNVDGVFWCLQDLLKEWRKKYTGSAGRLEFIAKNKQSIHSEVVAKKTDDGIKRLSEFPVPIGQKTLTEITAAWSPLYPLEQVQRVIDDMRYWGAKEIVMSRCANVYKNVLRGAWAKIKSYGGEITMELVKRLWEECNESIEMCADGHVGRIINVFIGFDTDIKVKTKSDFQDAVSKIASTNLALDMKIQEANKLMDEYNIAKEERQAWLDAF